MVRFVLPRRLLTVAALVSLAAAAACDEGAPTSPTGSAVVTFSVGAERFRVLLTTPEQIAAAEAARDGAGARIPIGRIHNGTGVNSGWNWHLEEVAFAEATVELCDGLPSYVERDGTAFANGWFCPWSAQVVSIQRQ
jgi:hypothetical protein